MHIAQIYPHLEHIHKAQHYSSEMTNKSTEIIITNNNVVFNPGDLYYLGYKKNNNKNNSY